MKAGRVVKGHAIHPGANLRGADLYGAFLWRTKKRGSRWVRTTLPDGTITDSHLPMSSMW